MKDMTQTMQASKVEQSFRRGLKTYDACATEQARIARHLSDLMAQYLPQNLGQVLEFGMGTGHLTRQLAKRFEVKHLYLNDLVDSCARFAPQEATFTSGAIEDMALPGNLDVVCSASTVQWLENIPATLQRLTDALAPGGCLALSGFGHQQFHELRALGSSAAAPNYLDADHWEAVLPPELTIRYISQKQSTLWFPTALSLLKHLRDTGVNGAASQAWTSQDLKAFEADYQARFGTDRGLPLTYDPVWVLAQKG